MAQNQQREFFLLRYVPDLVKNEFVNFGVIMLPAAGGPASVQFAKNLKRVHRLDPNADIEMLQALEEEIQNKLSNSLDAETLINTIQSSFSGTIQISNTMACETDSPDEEIRRLAGIYLDRPSEVVRGVQRPQLGGRIAIINMVKDAFIAARVWPHMQKNIRVSPYTRPGDPLKIDCGYRPNGTVKLFHAVSLAGEVESAKALAFSYPRIAEGIARQEKAQTQLTAVVEDDLDRKSESVAFALDTLQQTKIVVAAASEMPRFAALAAKELRV